MSSFMCIGIALEAMIHSKYIVAYWAYCLHDDKLSGLRYFKAMDLTSKHTGKAQGA